ncbi:hypothetical protein OAF98_05445 [Planctomicrobium sp.]|jgi:hypothetical protein|nr:hypothetical protein [Planctomicrobium sp.]MBT5018887.1 hypothetical protein [Planctomicrobium sp.]MDB4731546.1 hypothetical protein [bacterium]MDB4743912.1 hypothetical protein [Planctomicrobium sp.]
MIKFADKYLPYSERVYIAFRIAFLETQERLVLAEQLDLGSHRAFGFLTHVPFLKSVPAQVQLDLLLDVWDKHLSKEDYSSNYLDEAIVYAACETAAHLMKSEPEHAQRLISCGPLQSSFELSGKSATQFQELHLDFAGEGHYLLLSQCQDLSPEESSEFKNKYGVITGKSDCLFDALSRWHVASGFEDRACGLLTDEEVRTLSEMPDFINSSNKVSP